MKRICFISICFLFVIKIFSQEIEIGEWRDHLPYSKVIDVAEYNDLIYAATPYALFTYDKSNYELNRITKINGLSDIGVCQIESSLEYNILIIAYLNSNIDLVYGDKILNLSDIKRKNIIGDKTIYNITIEDRYAYLSCGFGIVVIDLYRKEIKDSYFIGDNGDQLKVNDICFDENYIYAATVKGVKYASKNSGFLSDYNQWNNLSSLPNANYNSIVYFNDKLIVNRKSNSYNNDSLFYFNNNQWNFCAQAENTTRTKIIKHNNSLFLVEMFDVLQLDSQFNTVNKIYTYGNSLPMPNNITFLSNDQMIIADNNIGIVLNSDPNNFWNAYPDGPASSSAYDMQSYGGVLWVVPGAKNQAWNHQNNKDGISKFENGTWTVLNSSNNNALDTITDLVSVSIDPQNPNHVFFGSWGKGLLEVSNDQIVSLYDDNNTNNIIKPVDYDFIHWVGVEGLKYDNQNNLWIVNSQVTTPLCVLKSNGTWQNFNFGGSYNLKYMGKLLIDNSNQKWIITRREGLVVFTDNNTLDNTTDDKVKVLTSNTGQGALPNEEPSCFALDKNGSVWVGFIEGIAVFDYPENIFTNYNFDARKVYLEQDGYGEYLLSNESILDIEIDGANRKWIATSNGGAFLMSEDGTEQIYHFTKENSPLYSNTVMSIAIDGLTGEVFFGTDKGIISFKGTATEGSESFTDVYAYPNPVLPGYNGEIGIKGLVENANVKITDITGNIVFETTALGGQAVWDAKTFSGSRVKTGVYLIFCANEDGSKTFISKILVIN